MCNYKSLRNVVGCGGNRFGSVRMPSIGSQRNAFLKGLIVACATIGFLPNPVAAQFVAPDSMVAGKTMDEWVMPWAIWAFTEPEATNSGYDQVGEFQHLNQEGPVWFLPWPRGDDPSRITHNISFDVPSDKYLFAPIIIGWTGSSEQNDWDVAARDFNDANDIAHIELDGVFTIPAAELLADYRAASGEFYYHIPDGLADPEEGYVAFDGHWVMLEPLSPGEHTIKIQGGASADNFFAERTLTITSVLAGDFDRDNLLSVQDIDLLLPGSGNDPNGDGLVDLEDRRYWIEDLFGSFLGDANLDKKVDFADFLSLSTNYGQQGGWAAGDFDGSGDVQFDDFLLLSENFSRSAEQIASVPEPELPTITLLLACVALSLWRRPTQ